MEISERLQAQIRFLLEIDQEKLVIRQTSLTHHGRKENDAEHAWHMAVMAYLLSEYSNEKINVGHTMIMCLIHDLVEIYAGDTYAYDEAGKKNQKEREEKAKKKLFSLLPSDQEKELSDIFEEFEEDQTPEAHFARAMDNFQPLILNNSNGGGDWKEHNVSVEQVMNRQKRTEEGSDELFQVTKQILEENVKKGSLRKDHETD